MIPNSGAMTLYTTSTAASSSVPRVGRPHPARGGAPATTAPPVRGRRLHHIT
ncbi:MAG: hypothetical protein L0K27_12190 [Corynebacterium nuruki]|nr:hypothetical protein [Corynebacterium nuruki]